MTPAGEGRPNDVDADAFPPDFRDFVHELNAATVEYLLVGGYAVGVHGHIRATIDIDFFYRATPENVDRLIHALVAFGAPEDIVDRAQLLERSSVSQFGEPPTRIDLIAEISGVTFDEALEGAVHIPVGDDHVSVIGLNALRKNKRASGRKKDRDDLRHLRAAAATDTKAKAKRAAASKKRSR